MGKQAIMGAQRVDAFWVDPDSVTLVTDPNHPSGLYQSRACAPPRPDLIASMLGIGWLRSKVVVLRKDGDQLLVVAGRSCTIAARAVKATQKAAQSETIRMLAVVEGGDIVRGVSTMLGENEGHVAVDPIERARGYQKLRDLGVADREIAARLNLKLPQFLALMATLEVAPEIQKQISAGKVSVTSATQIAKLPMAQQAEALAAIPDGTRTGVREVAAAVKVAKASAKAEAKGDAPAREAADLQMPPKRSEIRAVLERLEDEGDRTGRAGDSMIEALRWCLDGTKSQEIRRLLAVVAKSGGKGGAS